MFRFGAVFASLRRFRTDRRGVAAVEFALIAPMMLAILFVSFELMDASTAVGRSETTAASLADIVSRDVIVTDEEIDDLFVAADALIFPSPPARVTLRVTSAAVDSDGRATVVWSDARGVSPFADGASLNLPASLAAPDTGVVMVETTFAYRPPLGLFSAEPFEIRKVEYRRPRILDPVQRDRG